MIGRKKKSTMDRLVETLPNLPQQRKSHNKRKIAAIGVGSTLLAVFAGAVSTKERDHS